MKIHRLLFPAALALLALAPWGGRAPSLTVGAQASFSSWGDTEEQPQPNAVADFLREHGKIFLSVVAVALFVIFNFIMGPTGGYGYRRGLFRRGGFGSNGGFGGSTSMKNPWE